ncbi:MAG: serine/threonine protein kinase [Mycobacterium sp.]|nr:serine/threonine protein kinase [Mycobacterium sp.]
MSSGTSRAGTRFGKYELVALLGRGGMGEVYEARDTEKDRTVALKILSEQYTQDAEFRQRFTREAHAAAKVEDPHVIPIHDWGEIDGNLYIDMRLVKGDDLHAILTRGPMAPERSVNVIGQVAGALDAAHAAGLIHRDVKPANIVLTTDDFAYLLDFGIAEGAGESHLTQTGMTVGSFAYIAPERLSGEAATAAVDIYALACVLHETLTGARPFGDGTAQQQLTAHLTKPPPRPSLVNPAVPAAMDAVIARGMAKEPGDRYSTAAGLARAAADALRAPVEEAPSPTRQAGTGDWFNALHTPGPDDPPVSSGAPVGYGPTHSTGPRPQQPPQPTPPPSGPVPYPPQQSGPSGYQTGPTPYYAPPMSSAGPAYPPPAAPPVMAQPTGGNNKPWLIPVLIAVAVIAVVLGGIGIVVGMSDNGSDTATAPTTSRGRSTETGSYASPTSSVPTRPAALPPGVHGADSLGNSCDAGFSHGSSTEFGSRAVRGTDGTSCTFARNILDAYWAAGTPDSGRRTLSVPGAVLCKPASQRCNGSDFVVECFKLSTDDWITCEGGTLARVYIY